MDRQRRIVLRAVGWGLIALGFMATYIPGTSCGSLQAYECTGVSRNDILLDNLGPAIAVAVLGVAGIVLLVVVHQSAERD